jgi:hypothetical protein
MIAFERARQIEEEGWTAMHDDQHDRGELAQAAACYAVPGGYREIAVGQYEEYLWQVLWPWDGRFFAPRPDDRIRELVKAGALIAAEIDRLQRLARQAEAARSDTRRL